MRPLLAILLLAVLPATALAEAGDLDPRFGTRGRAVLELRDASLYVSDIALQADGRSVVAGVGRSGWLVQRLTRAGRPDRTFSRDGRREIPELLGSRPEAVEVLPDGRILVAGSDDATGLVFRLLPDGRLDPAWGDGGRAALGPPEQVEIADLAIQPDGGVVLATSARSSQFDERMVVWRLGPGGRLDSRFGDGGRYGTLTAGRGSASACSRRVV